MAPEDRSAIQRETAKWVCHILSLVSLEPRPSAVRAPDGGPLRPWGEPPPRLAPGSPGAPDRATGLAQARPRPHAGFRVQVHLPPATEVRTGVRVYDPAKVGLDAGYLADRSVTGVTTTLVDLADVTTFVGRLM